MARKSGSSDALKERLGRYRQITIRVKGRKSGRSILNPVWFVYEEDKLYLLPVKGSSTQWYKNVLQDSAMQIDARGAEASVTAVAIRDHEEVSTVVEKFREKYGVGDVKKYYSNFDVAVMITL
jgi:deazaflavin-dependent oxidoreductase (nitroreductase family)